MYFSDAQIEEVVELIKTANGLLKIAGFKGKAKDEELLIDIKRVLKMKQNGWTENVCPTCLGTGLKNKFK